MCADDSKNSQFQASEMGSDSQRSKDHCLSEAFALKRFSKIPCVSVASIPYIPLLSSQNKSLCTWFWITYKTGLPSCCTGALFPHTW